MTTKTKRSGGLALGAALLAAALAAAWATARAGGEEEPAAPLTIAQLTARAQALRTQIGQGEQGVQALADEMAKLYAHASGAGGVPWDEWAPLVTPLGEYLSPEARAAMSESLARTDVSLAPHAKLKAFYECLLALDDEPAAVALTRRWVLASRGYKDLPLASLVELSLLTPRADDDGGAGRRVGEAILDKLLKDPQAAPSLPLARWCELAGRVGSALTAEQKAQWAEKLQMICTGADVSWEQLQLVLQAAGELGRADKSGYVTGWMAREPNQWQGLGADQLVALAGPLAGPGEPARAWREKIASQLEQTLLASPAAVRAQGNALGATIQAMAPGLSDAQKPRWRAKVREAFQAKASMTPADLQAVSDWLGLLGEAPANAHVADWTLAQTAWQGWASQDVRWLMGQLVGLGGGARDARSKVATHVTSTTISRPEGLATMPAAELGELVSAVAPALTTAQRREALEAMRAAFGGKAMSAGVLRSVEAVVRPLGEGAFVDFVAEWVGTQKSWQEFSLSDLNSLHELLKISPSARGPRASVAAQLTAAVLGDAKAMQGAPVEAVCQAAEGIARGAPSPVRERWTAALRARYGQAPLAGTDLARVRQTLATLGDVGGEEFLAGWVAVQASWTTWPSQDLAGLVGQLRGRGERTRAARAKIAAHVAARVAQPQAPEAAAGLGGLVQAVAGDWTALQRSQCVTALRVEVGPKAASLEDLRAIEPVCRPLGEEVFGTVVGDWVNAQADWQRFSPADLNAMVDLLKPSQTARGTRVKVAAQLTALALNDATAFHGLSPASICLRARGIAPDLAPALRERWIAALRGLFGKAAINRTELADVRETLHALGDAQSEQFLADWVAAQGSWTAWSGQDIVGLLGQLKGTGEAARAARSKLAAQLSATVVAPEALASMPLETLGQVVAPAAAGWTAAQRAAFLASAGPALMVRANSIETLRAVEPICRALGDDAFGGFLARWVDGQQAWRQFSLADMNALYGLMKGAGCRQPARASVVARIIATILGDAQSLDPAAAGALSQSARALATDMLPAVREQWVGSIHTAFAKAPLSLADLAGLREALTALGDARSEQFIPAWVASQGAWKNWSSDDLSALGARVSGAGDSAKAARGEIAAHRAAQIAQREALAAMSTSALQQFVQSAGSWSPAQRSQCLASVRAVFGAKAMPLDTLRALAGVFQSLGAEAEYLPFVGEWVNSQDAWQRYSLADMNALYDSLRGPEGLKPARAKIAAQVTGMTLGEAKNDANATAGALCQAARTVLPDASGAVREQWGGAIRTMFAKAPLTRAELTDVESTLAALGEAHPEAFVNAWSAHQECWKTWPISDLAAMVASGGASADMKAVRARASAHMLSLATAGAGTLGAMPVSTLSELVRSAGGTWTDAQRAQVAAAVKSAFKARPISVGELRGLEPLFLSLADAGFLAFADAWATEQTCWQKDSTADMLSLYDLLKRSESSQALRGKIVAKVTATVLGDAKGLQGMSAGALCGLAQTVLPEAPDALRAQWATTLRTKFAKAPVGAGELATVREGLRAMGDLAASEQFVPYWVANQPCWKTWAAQDLPGLIGLLDPKTDSGKAARGVIATHVMSVTIAQPDALGALSIGTLAGLLQGVAPEWTQAQRTAGLEAVRAVYTAKPLSVDDLRSLEGVFRPLSGTAFASFVTEWVDTRPGWQEATPNELITLFELLRSCAAPRPIRERVATVLTAAVMGNAQTLQAMSLGQRCQMAQTIAPAGTPEVRGQWAALLRTTFPTAVNTSDLSGLREAFKALGDARFEECVNEWVAAQGLWRNWAPGDLANLAGLLGNSPVTRPAREALAMRATEKFMASGEAVPEGGWGVWRAMAVALGTELAPEQRVRWADKILAAFTAGNDASQGVRVGEAVEVARSLQALGQADKLADSALSWLQSGGNYEWPKLSLGDFVALAVCVGAKDKDKAAAFIGDLEAKVLRSSKLDWNGFRDIASAWGQIGETDKARAWYVRLCEADLTNELSSMSVWNVAVRLSETGSVAPGKGNPAYATALAKLAQSGQLTGPAPLWEHDTMWGEPLGSADTRAIVQAEVTDPAGNPRLNVANILAWANKFDNNMPAWLSYLDGQAQAATDGDVKATWLRAKAYARAIMSDEISPRNGMGSLKQALTVASSDEMRMTIIEDYATYSRAIGQPMVAANLIESMKGQLSEGTLAGAMRMQQLQDSLQAEDAARKADFERHQAVVAAAQRQATLDNYYKRLAAAQAAGNDADAASLKAAIANIESGK